MSIFSPDFLQKMAVYRRKAADGTITIDEMREAVALMREGRKSAIASSSTKQRTAKPKADAVSMLNELDSL